MPDWTMLVEERLRGIALDEFERSEVVAELAAHLEDAFAAYCAAGLPDDEAAHRTLEEAGNWGELRRNIPLEKQKEVRMRDRMAQLWIPGYVNLVLSMSFLTLLMKFGILPRILRWSDPGTVLFYLPWLAALPLFGLLAAHLSDRAGGALPVRLLAAAFPVLSLAAVFFVILPLATVIDRQVPLYIKADAFLAALIGWVLVPGAGLLAGGFFQQWMLSPSSDRRSISS